MPLPSEPSCTTPRFLARSLTLEGSAPSAAERDGHWLPSADAAACHGHGHVIGNRRDRGQASARAAHGTLTKAALLLADLQNWHGRRHHEMQDTLLTSSGSNK